MDEYTPASFRDRVFGITRVNADNDEFDREFLLANIHQRCIHMLGKYCTPLIWAVDQNYFNIVQYLVDQGADVTDDDNYAIGQAARNGNLAIIKFFIKKGADIHAAENYAIRTASFNGHLCVSSGPQWGPE